MRRARYLASHTGDMSNTHAHRVGIIGLGTVGRRFVDLFTADDRFDLVACWDASDTARGACEAPVVADADQVIAAADLVYIAVPPAAHGDYVRRCVAAGRAMLCEKPLGVDVADSRELTALVDSSGLAAAVNFVHGSAPAAVELGRRLANGDAGDVTVADLRVHMPLWPRAWQAEATWLGAAAEGGWTREIGSHFVFCARRVLGGATLVAATVRRPDPTRAEDLVHARLDCAGVPMLITGTSGGAGPEIVEFIVRGTQRSFRIVDWYRLEVTNDDDVWTPVDLPAEPTPAVAAYRAQLDQIAAMLDGAAHTLPTFADALAVQEIVEGILSAG